MKITVNGITVMQLCQGRTLQMQKRAPPLNVRSTLHENVDNMLIDDLEQLRQ